MLTQWLQRLKARLAHRRQPPALQDPPEAPASRLPTADAVREIAAQAPLFCGLYEPLYQLAQGNPLSREAVWDEWRVRATHKELQRLLAVLTAYGQQPPAQAAGALLPLLEEAGIQREPDGQLLVDERTALRYGMLDGSDLTPGAAAQVLAPAWRQGDIILERGVLLPMTEERP